MEKRKLDVDCKHYKRNMHGQKIYAGESRAIGCQIRSLPESVREYRAFLSILTVSCSPSSVHDDALLEPHVFDRCPTLAKNTRNRL